MGNISGCFMMHHGKTTSQVTKTAESDTKECEICVFLHPNNQKYFTKVDGCTHIEKVCVYCLDRHVLTEINTKGNMERIKCPTTNCSHNFSYSEIRKITRTKTFQRFDHLLTMKSLATRNEFRWCKAEGCESGQLHDAGEDYPIVNCFACNAQSCYVHESPWHYNKTCKEFDIELEKKKDIATTNYKKKNTKNCPKCKAPIEKIGGCDHMTCKNGFGGCGHGFCWLCLEDYSQILKEGNHLHNIDCYYYVPFEEGTAFSRYMKQMFLEHGEEDSEADDESTASEDWEGDVENHFIYFCRLCQVVHTLHSLTYEETDTDEENDEDDDFEDEEEGDDEEDLMDIEDAEMLMRLEWLDEDE
jgi:hypothetical protein